MKRIVEIIADLKRILAKQYLSGGQKRKLVWTYCVFAFRRFGQGRFLSESSLKRVSLVGFRIEVENFLDFYWTFLEVFMDDDYAFQTEKKDPFIIDLGGNTGVTAIFFKWLYPKAHIDVYEALSENATILRNNIELNKFEDVRVIQKAVGGERGNLKIYGNRRAATIKKDLGVEDKRTGKGGEQWEELVEIIPLSEELDGTTVDFLKMDIEGAESDVIKDLHDAGKLQNVSQLRIEYHHFSFDENKLSSIIDSLEQNSFDVTFSGDYTNLLTMPKQEHYNFMLSARRRE